MLNTKQFNLIKFNEWKVWITWFITWEIVFWDFILHKTNNISLNYTNINSWPSVEDNTYNKPDINWVWLNSYFLRAKTINLNWILKWNNKEDLEKRMINMIWKLAEVNKFLQIITWWIILRARAYCKNLDNIFNNRQYFHNTFVPFNITFQINSPFWEGVLLNSITYNINSTLLEEIQNLWNAEAEPIINITFNSASWVDEIWLEFNNKNIIIQKNISVNDIIKIDSEQKNIFLNWDEIDYLGELPTLKVWSNPFVISINWTFNADVSIIYRDKFI